MYLSGKPVEYDTVLTRFDFCVCKSRYWSLMFHPTSVLRLIIC